MASFRTKRALQHRIPSASDRIYEVGDKVLVWREKAASNYIGEWTWPYSVESVSVDKKIVYIRVPDPSASVPFNLAQVKPYVTPDIASLFPFRFFICVA